MRANLNLSAFFEESFGCYGSWKCRIKGGCMCVVNRWRILLTDISNKYLLLMSDLLCRTFQQRRHYFGVLDFSFRRIHPVTNS